MDTSKLIQRIIKRYKEIFLKEPTYEDLLLDCIKLRGVNETEFLVTKLQEGWLQNNGEPIDFASLYNKYFGYDRIGIYEGLEQIQFQEYKKKQVTEDNKIINSGGNLFDKYIWGTLEEIYNKQQILYGFITNVFDCGYEVTFDVSDILFIPKNLDLEYPKIRGFVPKEKYKYFNSLNKDQFRDIKYDVKILFIEKSSKTLILKPCNYEI